VSLSRAWAMFIKELRHILRDPRSLLMALALPLFQLLLFGYALNLDVDRIPTMIYDGNPSPASRDLIDGFRGSRFFDVQALASGSSEVERAINRGRVLLGIVIPYNYSQQIAAGKRADVQVIVDGSDSNTASIALAYVESVIQTQGIRLRIRSQQQFAGFTPTLPVDARVRVWYNDTLESKNFVVPGLVAIILMIISSLLTSLTIAREFEMGTMEQLLSTALRPIDIVIGKMGAFFLVGVVDTVMSVLVAIYVFAVPFRGDVLLLAVTSCVFLCGAMSMGLLVSSLAESQLVAFQVGMVTSFLPGFLLSGFIYTIENMPAPIQMITRVVPARYFVTIVRAIFQKGVGLEVLLPDVMFLLGFSLLAFLLATAALRRRMDF
jgi:drug efflux transport system permease protein